MGNGEKPTVRTSNPATKAALASSPELLGLDDYAALCAEIDAGVEKSLVLDRKGISEESFARAQAHWLKRMSDEAERNRFHLTTRYQANFRAKRSVFEARLRRDRDRETRSKIEPPPITAVAAADQELRAPLVSSLPSIPLRDPPPIVPRAQHHPHAFEPRTLPRPVLPHNYAEPAPIMAHAPPPLPEPPVTRATGPRPPPVEPPSTVKRPPVGSITTPPSTSPMGHAPEPAMPFAPGPPKAAPAPSIHPSVNRPPKSLVATMPSRDTDAPRAPAVPFRPGVGSAAAVPQPGPAPSTGSPALGAPPPNPPNAATMSFEGLASRPKKLFSTMMVDVSALQIDALPFHADSAHASPLSSPSPAPSPPAHRSPSPLPSPSTHPSQSPHPSQSMGQPSPSTLQRSPAIGSTEEAPPSSDMGRTGVLDPAMVAKAMMGATPFAKNPSSPPSMSTVGAPMTAPAPTTTKSAPPVPHPADEDSVDSTRTHALPPENAQALLAQQLGALPFDRSDLLERSKATTGPGPQKSFPIDVFASLTAEIAENPGAVASTRARYGITEAAHLEESRRWTAAFDQDPELRERYLSSVRRYRSYLQGQAKK